jgi:hypothetical protein
MRAVAHNTIVDESSAKQRLVPSAVVERSAYCHRADGTRS